MSDGNVIDLRPTNRVLPKDLKEQIAEKTDVKTADVVETVLCHYLVSKCVAYATKWGEIVGRKIVSKLEK